MCDEEFRHECGFVDGLDEAEGTGLESFGCYPRLEVRFGQIGDDDP